MNFRNTLLPTCILALFVYYLHITALREHLYFHHWWFHMIIHVLTGAVLALATLYIYAGISSRKGESFTKLAAVALPFVLLCAVGWEIFELMTGLIYITGTDYTIDTTKGIFTGLAGGLFGISYAHFIHKRTS